MFHQQIARAYVDKLVGGDESTFAEALNSRISTSKNLVTGMEELRDLVINNFSTTSSQFQRALCDSRYGMYAYI